MSSEFAQCPLINEDGVPAGVVHPSVVARIS